ncbi:hypothetical protein BST37_15460 [Mycobacterium noviomagense]|nr:hypothetical protein BST37_15460 [Mycobacterium noviomagense]
MAVVAALVAAMAAIGGVVVYYREHDRVVPRHTTPDSQAMSAPPTAAPSQPLLDKDGRFIFLLTAQGLQVRTAPDATISDAHRVCLRIARGESEQQVVQDIVQGTPGMSADTATAFAETAISVYCPEGSIDEATGD